MSILRLESGPSMGAKAAVLWTGGKDCCLALHEAHSSGVEVTTLVTFVPEVNPVFLAHPLPLMALQAEALGLPHLQMAIGQPYKERYVEAIRALKRDHGIDVLVTGDIDVVDCAPDWIRECAKGTGVEVVTPLWQLPRSEILAKVLALGLDVRISCVKTPFLDASWVARQLCFAAVEELEELEKKGSFDACGENGDYHTMVLDAPLFRKSITLGNAVLGRKDDLVFWQWEDLSPFPKWRLLNKA